ncbi:MAG: ATP-dependent helicase [Promethearchaeota archaeon]
MPATKAAKKIAKRVKLKPRPVSISADLAKDLNEEQKAVVSHTGGPALVVAGAGSGKTRALTYRVAQLLKSKEPPSSIVLVTFTKKAALEMISRVDRVVGGAAKGVLAGTFHHIANFFLRTYAKVLGYQPDFTILDRGDQRDLMKYLLGIHRPKNPERRLPSAGQLVDIQSTSVNLQLSVPDVVNMKFSDYAEEVVWIEAILDAYAEHKRRANVMDFDDLMVNFLELLRHDSVGPNIRKGVRHVLVDEYQDVNAIQAELVDLLALDAKSLTVVGDDAQAIYGFRGSDFSHMLEFPTRHAGVVQYKLETNYRSTPEILALANASIRHNVNQFEKTLRPVRKSGEKPAVVPCTDSQQEANFICTQILEFRSREVPLHEQAVLFRAHHHSIELQLALQQYNIPFEIRAGLTIFEKAHVKDLFALLVLFVNPRDEIQWNRVLTLLQGMGPKSARRVLDHLISSTNPLESFVGLDLAEALAGQRVTKKAKDSLASLQRFLANSALDQAGHQLPADQLEPLPNLVKHAIEFLEPHQKQRYRQYEDRRLELEEIARMTSRFGGLQEALNDLMLVSIQGESQLRGDQEDRERPLVLSTIHQAKGLEWDVVFVLSAADGRLPSDRSFGHPSELEEERRLFYVACTRARDHLIITYPETQLTEKGHLINQPSMFIEEVEEDGVFDWWEVE